MYTNPPSAYDSFAYTDTHNTPRYTNSYEQNSYNPYGQSPYATTADPNYLVPVYTQTQQYPADVVMYTNENAIPISNPQVFVQPAQQNESEEQLISNEVAIKDGNAGYCTNNIMYVCITILFLFAAGGLFWFFTTKK
jgi:hypothetical protein